MDSINDNDAIRKQAAMLLDKYQAIMQLVAIEDNPETVTRLRHEAKKTWHEWLKASEALIIRDSYERRIE
jgi:hypothetical protein